MGSNQNKFFSAVSILILLFTGSLLFFGALPAASQETGTYAPNKYYTITTVILSNGAVIEKDTINGPPVPPPGFEIERQAVSLPTPDSAAGISILTVPAFNWVFGCSAVSGAMIAGYYDRAEYSNMYTGPTNGGVMPLDNSSWPTWSDGYATYPNCPLIASKNGVDGRATRGSIDDYWVQYNSPANDPYITNGWTQHTWGDAIGDYMKTSQSAYGNTDGSTTFYNYISSSAQLTCATMAGSSLPDGTLGRKLFYEAKGYTVTDCYNQKTDNTIAGGFSFAQFKAEIDAGRPVMLNLAGHTVVGVGYDDSSSLVYIHDTWDYSNHTMTWGGSYSGMALQSVSIVNLQGITSPGTISLSSSGYSVNENSGTVTITATRTGGSTGAVGINYVTSDGTAITDSDYTSASGTLSWADSDSASKTFTVSITNDTLDEANETFTVALSSPTGGASLGSPSSATVTINDDDAAPTVQFQSATSNGDESVTPAAIIVTLSAESGKTVTVGYATANGTAIAVSDYTATSGTLTFNPGGTSQTINVPVINDNIIETNETFTVTLSVPTNATLGTTTTHTYTINNDDFAGTIQLNSATYSVSEGDPTVTITATRTGGSSGAVGASYATSNGTATSGSDYTAKSGTLSWATGDTADKTFTVSITNDVLDEPDETFTVTLSTPTGGASLGGQSSATVTITDDDAAPTVQFSAASSNGSEAVTPAAITATLSAVSGKTVTVGYATADGTASAGSDYTTTSGTLTFDPGVTSQTINVPVINDNIIETNETFTVTLSVPTNATLGTTTTHTYTINNDDFAGTIQLNSATYSVSEAGPTVTITATRTGGSSGVVGASYATSDGTATAGSDYTSASGTLSWAEGDSANKTFTVAITDDAQFELNETFTVILSTPTGGATLGTTDTATVTITDNDQSTWYDHFNDLSYTDNWTLDNCGLTTTLESRTLLHIAITKPLADCSYMDLESIPVFSGTNLVFETGVRIEGNGEMRLRLKKDDNNFVQFGIKEFGPDGLPDFIIGSSENSTYTEQALDLTAEYALKKKYKYKTFSIVKTGDEYRAYLNGMDTGGEVTNALVGDAGLKVELLNGVCSTELKGTNNYFDYVFVSETVDGSIPATDLKLLTPNGGEAIKIGSIYLVLWEGPAGASYYSIDYSVNGGLNWVMLDSAVEGKFYTWKLQKENPYTTYKLRVKAHDSIGAVIDSDASDTNFTVQY